MNPGHFYLLNLGCAKNLVEGEHLAGLLTSAGYVAVPEPAAAELLVVNTCGFIQPAVEESLEAVLELAHDREPGQRLVVVGCLVGRYGKKLAKSLPEATLLVGPGELPRLLTHLAAPPESRLALSPPLSCLEATAPRHLSTGPGWAYLRVADGCERRCAFCTIPAIRGRLRSRPLGEVVAEARLLAASGVKEINLVAQDLTAYGADLGLDHGLARLLAALDQVEGLAWIRLLYLHPDYLDLELVRAMAAADKVLPYFDLPLQHLADPVLQLMGRRRTGRQLRGLLVAIRQTLPEAIFRTTLLVGHPGEDEAAFQTLYDFVAETGFHHLGVFPYCPEAGTRSARLPHPPRQAAQERAHRIMALQRRLSRAHLKSLKGSRQEILYLGPHPESELVRHGRAAFQAPEVDGEVLITDGAATPGSLVTARITKSHDYDLEAVLV
ncbi:MAG: 30S ribosomal protein S12 methylthiotransferase RimO [Deltaproteobacteria bacterium]|nr:30S ribosomal protein S12 methylthiotransferase RimO [Deltaproteobacteria bacterium]